MEKQELHRWRCTVCNYVYDPVAGDPDGGVPPGTAFEDIPDTWLCPVCQVGKEYFEPAKVHHKRKSVKK